MKQLATQQFSSDCEKAKIFVLNDMPIGQFHDFLMEIKGLMADRMLFAHKEQLSIMEEKKEETKCDEESGCAQKEKHETTSDTTIYQ